MQMAIGELARNKHQLRYGFVELFETIVFEWVPRLHENEISIFHSSSNIQTIFESTSDSCSFIPRFQYAQGDNKKWRDGCFVEHLFNTRLEIS